MTASNVNAQITTAGRSSAAVQSASHTVYSTGSPQTSSAPVGQVRPASASQTVYSTGSSQIASSPAGQARNKSPFVAAHSAPPTPTMSPPIRIGKDPRSPGATSPTESTATMWKAAEFTGAGGTNHVAAHGMPVQSLAATSPVATVQSFASSATAPPPTNGRPSTPSSSSSSTLTYQITPTGYVIFGSDARSQQVRRDMEELLPLLLPGLTLHTGPEDLAEAEAQLVRLAESLAVALQKRYFLLQVARGDYPAFPPEYHFLPVFNAEVLKRAYEAEQRNRAPGGASARDRERERERQRMRRAPQAQMLEEVDTHMSNGDAHHATNGNYAAANGNAAAAAAGAAGAGGGGGGSSPMSPPAFYPTASGGEASFRRM